MPELPGGPTPLPGNAEFVKQWTKIVLILAVTLATLNGVNITPVI